ncbi:MAG: heme lyase CcmF/NrfE family subunit [Thermomicrobiaceae bacterium]
MAELGSGVLIVALLLSTYGFAVAIIGARRNIPELVESSIRATWGVAALVVIASGALLYAFFTHDFSLDYVAGRSSTDMPIGYVLSAFWGGQEGSLLYWTTVSTVLSSIAITMHRRRDRALIPYVAATSFAINIFFLLMLTIVTSPFSVQANVPAEGAGLNPLLRDPGMIIHPPLLLGGFAAFAVPFCFAVAALVTGRLGEDWIRAIRHWALIAWGVLGLGLLIGAWWAYHVLGWGGYWGWDPVENVALLPWLTATAFIHSVIVQERRGMLKIWNMSLIVASFLLAVFATFVVRSGVLSSVHSFATSEIGPWFLGFLSILMIGSVGLLIYRIPGLQSDRQLESVVSREGGFLFNNLLFTAMAFATFWGTVFPIVSELFRDTKLMVGPPFYDQVNGPILLALIVLMGIGPLLAWRRSSTQLLYRNLAIPGLAGIAAAVAGIVMLGEILASIAIGATVFAVGTIVLEYVRGARARHRSTGEMYPVAVTMLVRKNSRRYGGYIVHLAIAIMAIGVIGSHFFQIERQFVMEPGDTGEIGEYTVTFQGLDERQTADASVISAVVDVARNGDHRDTVESYRYFYRNFEDQPTAQMGITTLGIDDVYVVLDRWEDDGTVGLRVFVNPMVSWIWFGGGVFIIGMLTLFWPDPKPSRSRATGPAREAVLREA